MSRAKVERRHREAALQLLGHRAYYNTGEGRKSREKWLKEGERVTLSSCYSHEWEVAQALADTEMKERLDVIAELERVERLSGGDAANAVRALLVTFQRGEHKRPDFWRPVRHSFVRPKLDRCYVRHNPTGDSTGIWFTGRAPVVGGPVVEEGKLTFKPSYWQIEIKGARYWALEYTLAPYAWGPLYP